MLNMKYRKFILPPEIQKLSCICFCLRVVPVRANPVEAFRGQGKGGATARLLVSRKQDLPRE